MEITLKNTRIILQEQYVYLHEALAEALLMGSHHVLTRQFENIYQYIIGKEKGSNSSRLDEQFDVSKSGRHILT